MELTRAGSAVLRRVYLLVLGAVLVSAAAYAWSARHHPTYRATAQVVVTLHIGSAISSRNLFFTETLAQQYAAHTLPDAVVDAIYLAVPARTPANIRRELTMSAVAGQPLISITTQDISASVAQNLSNSAAIAFVNYYSQQNSAAESALAQQETALQTQLQQLNGKISQTQTALAAAQKRGGDTSALSQQLTDLQAQQSQLSNQLATVTKQRLVPLADFWVASQATASQQVGANPQANAAYGAAAGLFAGLCAALLLDLLDGTVRKSDDTLRFAGLSTLGAVRTLSAEEDEPSLIRQEEYTAVAGPYTALMKNLVFLSATRPLQTLLVTPTDAVSGMDQVGINLAITYALAGVRTLVVDANWQRPTLETRIGLPPVSQGLFTSLVAVTKDSSAALDAIAPTPVDNLFALPVGPLPPNLDELVQSSLLDRLNAALMAEFEQIVVLAPTELRDPTARHLVERMDGALIVARAGATTGRELADVSQALRRANAYLAGAVLMTQNHALVPDPSATTPGASRPRPAPSGGQPVSIPGPLPLDAGT